MSSASPSIQISGLSKTKLQALRNQAKSAGISAEQYARQLVESGILIEEHARTRTFDELTAEIRADFDASGMTEADLDRLVSAARKRQHPRPLRKKR